MADIIVAGNTSGSITLSAPAISGSSVLTLPVATDTLVGKATTDTLTNKTLGASVVQASNAAPAFSAYLGSSQTIGNGAWTKVVANTELFDTNSNYDSTTNYRFTPTVAGYYQLNICWQANAISTAIQLALYKNGASNVILAQTANSTATVSGSALVYSNGSTDYWEFYVNLTVGEVRPSTTGCFFSGSMIRSA